ncbi:hypothetical protein [Mycobacterium sp.]|uniref:hypothetical protein n=1 Tax=Mycobacterium sp. TaxID=1785 RepID=UPI003C72DBC4
MKNGGCPRAQHSGVAPGAHDCPVGAHDRRRDTRSAQPLLEFCVAIGHQRRDSAPVKQRLVGAAERTGGDEGEARADDVVEP